MIKAMYNLLDGWRRPFRSEQGVDVGVTLVFILINGLVFLNAQRHDPRVGYDAHEHLRYIEALSQFRLVTPEDSREFFSPPLPYAFPALLVSLTGMKLSWAAKLAQYVNGVLSIGLTWYLLRLCQLISPQAALRLGALVFLGMLPVYYKTFALVRGEPYVAFFAVVLIYYTLRFSAQKCFTIPAGVVLGSALGLCVLSRQWGLLLFPPVVAFLGLQWVRQPPWRRAIAKLACVCTITAVVMGGGFYGLLQVRQGSMAAFNRTPAAQLSFRNQPMDFYLGVSPGLLFHKPLRPNFPNQLIPILYSELWGDYWEHFCVTGGSRMHSEFDRDYAVGDPFSNGRSPHWQEANDETMGAYLGRVNRVSLFPTGLALASLLCAVKGVLKRRRDEPLLTWQGEIRFLLLLIVGTTVVGYVGFLVMYPSLGKGDTIKASYVLHVFPFVAILVGLLLERVKKQSPILFRIILGGLILVAGHNGLAMLTRYHL